jgi:hypothetical protein
LNLGALAVSDMLFDDNSVAEYDEEGLALSRCGSTSWRRPRLIQVSDSEDDSETLGTYGEEGTLEFTVTDGETTLTRATLEDDERNASDTDNNTLTDINTLMSSQMNGSHIIQKKRADGEKRERKLSNVATGPPKSRNKTLRKKKSRPVRDDDATLDSMEIMMFHELNNRTNPFPPKRVNSRSSHNSDDKENPIPAEITSPIVQRRVGTPFQLKRLVSKGRQRLINRNNRQYRSIPEPAVVESVVVSPTKLRHSEHAEEIPFDEPLWYN